MTGGQCIRACKIPDQASSSGHHSQAVRPFTVISTQRMWLQHRWNIRRRQSPLDQVVDRVVAHVTTDGLTAGEAVCTRTVHLLTTDTRMRCANGGTETQTDGDT